MGRKKGVILSYLFIILEVLSTLLITPFVIKSLGQAEYGVYKLAGAVNAYLLLLDLGIGNAITRFVAKYRANKDSQNERKFLGVVTVYYIAIAIVALLIGIVLVVLFPVFFSKGLTEAEIKLGQRLLSIIMLNSAVTLGTSAYANVLIGYERFGASKGASIAQIILRMGLTVLILNLGMKSIGIVIVQLILTIICRSFYVFYVLVALKIKPQLKGVNKSLIKEIVSYSSLILLQMIATQLNSTIDQILIGSIVQASSTIIAVYGVGTQIVQYYQSLGSAFNGVLMPGVVRLVEKKVDTKKLNEEMIRVGRIIFLILSPVWACFLVNGKQFVLLWVGEDNVQAYYVAILLMSAQLFIITETIGSQILWAKNEHKEQAYLKISIVFVNIILTIILIKWKPLIGATIGTLISLVLGDIMVMNLIFKKKFDFSIFNYFKGLLSGTTICLVGSIAIGFGINSLLNELSWFTFIIKIFIMVVTYISLVFLFGANTYEKGLIKSFIPKIKKNK